MPKSNNLNLLFFSTLLGFLNRFSTDIYAALLPFLIVFVGLSGPILSYSVQIFYLGALLAVLFLPYLLRRFSYSFFLNLLLFLTLAGGLCFLLYPLSTYFIILGRFVLGLGVGLLPIFVKLIVIRTSQKKYHYKTLKISNTLAKTNILYPLFPVLTFLVGSFVRNKMGFDIVAVLIICLSSIALLSLSSSKEIKLAQETKKYDVNYRIQNTIDLLKHTAIRNYAICFGLISSLIPTYYYTLNQHFLSFTSTPLQRYTLMLVPAIGLALGRPLNILATKHLQINRIIIVSLIAILFFSAFSFILLMTLHPLSKILEFLMIIPVFLAVSLIATNLTAKISNIFRKYSLEVLQIMSYSLYIFSAVSVQLSLLFAHKQMGILLLLFTVIATVALIIFLYTFFSKKSGIKTKRSEWRTEVFSTSNFAFLKRLKLNKLKFAKQYTSTVYFQNQKGELLTEPSIRLRSYVSLKKFDKNKLQYFIENGNLWGVLQIKKSDGTKYELCDIAVTPAQDGPTPWQVIYEEQPYYFHSIKIVKREHFGLADLIRKQNKVTQQILPRLTIDKDRLFFVMDEQGVLSYIGNLGIRIEFKYETHSQLEVFMSHLETHLMLNPLKYRSFEFLFQDKLRNNVIYKDKLGIPEIEKKFLIQNLDIHQFANKTIQFIKNKNNLKFVLPHPYLFSRIRKYHFCYDPSDPSDKQYTLIETLSGKYSIKIKNNSRVIAGNLIRDTQASYTTDLDGEETIQHCFHNLKLEILNSIVKYQYKIPFTYKGTFVFIFNIDECVDTKTTLRQLELEYSGTLDSKVTHSLTEILCALNQLNDELLKSNLASFLEHSEISKFHYFTQNVSSKTQALFTETEP